MVFRVFVGGVFIVFRVEMQKIKMSSWWKGTVSLHKMQRHAMM